MSIVLADNLEQLLGDAVELDFNDPQIRANFLDRAYPILRLRPDWAEHAATILTLRGVFRREQESFRSFDHASGRVIERILALCCKNDRRPCIGITQAGIRCANPANPGVDGHRHLTCGRHRECYAQCLPNMNGEHPERPSSGICQLCRETITTNYPPVHCTTCPVMVHQACADQVNSSLSGPDTKYQCEWCREHLQPSFLRLMLNEVDQQGNPTIPDEVGHLTTSIVAGSKRPRDPTDRPETSRGIQPTGEEARGPTRPAGGSLDAPDRRPTGGQPNDTGESSQTAAALAAITRLGALIDPLIQRIDALEARSLPQSAGNNRASHGEPLALPGSRIPGTTHAQASSIPTGDNVLTDPFALGERETSPPSADYVRSWVLPWSRMVGTKPNLDAFGRSESHVRHPFHNHVTASFDYLASIPAADCKAFREACGLDTMGTTLSRTDLVRYWTAALQYLYDFLHADNPRLNIKGPKAEGRRIEFRLLLIMARIKVLRAVLHQLEMRDIPWKQAFTFLASTVKERFADCRAQPLPDVFWDQLVEGLCNLTRQGHPPSFTDHLQDQIQSAAAGMVGPPTHLLLALEHYEDAEDKPRGQPRGGGARVPEKRVCPLCHSNKHDFRNHPAYLPITVPCAQCGFPHARTGPLATPCGHSRQQEQAHPPPPPPQPPRQQAPQQPARRVHLDRP